MNEFRLGKGVIPVIANGAHMGAPEVLKNVPADVIEGLMFIVANWQLKGQDTINDLSRSSRASRGSRRTASPAMATPGSSRKRLSVPALPTG